MTVRTVDNRGLVLDAPSRLLCQLSLLDFTKFLWPVLEPGVHMTQGRILEVMCEHLEAVTAGDIRKLLINVPPGCMKSMLVNVFWPTWEWVRDPNLRYITAAYDKQLTRRDNRRALQLCLSEQVQLNWPHLAIDPKEQNIDKFATMQKGWRIATATSARVMGERGDKVVIDDPNDTAKVDSNTTIEKSLQWFTEVLPNRVNQPDEAAMVCIMQRVHTRDVSGHILSSNLGWEHLCMPMEYDETRTCVTSIGFEDWRTEPKELLWPERFSRRYLDEDLYPTMRSWGGEYAIAGQYDQLPVAREGGMFRKKWFKEKVPEAPPGGIMVAGWDLAATSKAQNPRAAYTCRVLGKLVGGVLFIIDVKRERIEDSGVETYIHGVTKADSIKYGPFISVDFPKDPAASGKVQAKSIYRRLQPLNTSGIFSTPETGSKIHRAIPYSAMAQIGLVRLVEGDWNEEYISELGLFPRGTYMDQVDATSRMYGRMMLVNELDLPAPPIPVTAGQDLQEANMSVTVQGKSVPVDGFSIQEMVAGILNNGQDHRDATRRDGY